MRKVLLLLPLLVACSDRASNPTAPTMPKAPSLTWVFDTPRPTMVSAEIVGTDGPDYNIVRLTWNDNTDDESWSAFYFTSPTEFAMVLNAAGVAGTGVRTVDLPVPTSFNAVAVGAAWANDGNTLRTPYSASVPITEAATLTTAAKRKGKH